MPRQKAGMIVSPTEVTIQHLIPLYVVVHNEGDGEGPTPRAHRTAEDLCPDSG
jgi:hypothetical protein